MFQPSTSATHFGYEIAKSLQSFAQGFAGSRVRQAHVRIRGGLAEIAARRQRDMRLLQRTLAERPRIQTGAGNVEIRVERAVRFDFQRQTDLGQTVHYNAAALQQFLTFKSGTSTGNIRTQINNVRRE